MRAPQNSPFVHRLNGVAAIVTIATASACSGYDPGVPPEHEDAFLDWHADVDDYLGSCLTEIPEGCTREAKNCGAGALATHTPPIDDSTQAAQFQTSMWAGHLLVTIPGAAAILHYCLGVDVAAFSGSGTPIPFEETYEDSRGREYLSHNWLETEPTVWTWILPATQESFDLATGDIIETMEPTVASSTVDFSTVLPEILVKMDGPHESLPPLTRLGTLEPSWYHGYVSRPDAIAAFFLDAQTSWHLTMAEAAETAGFEIEPDEKRDLYLWVYNPVEEDNVLPATWSNIFEKLPDWLAE